MTKTVNYVNVLFYQEKGNENEKDMETHIKMCCV